MKKEIWKDIPGHEGFYQISNFGRLKSFKSDKNGRILKNTNKNGWYFTVVLQSKNKPTVTKRIHRLVAELFIPNPNNCKQVNHKDLNKQNNDFSNLEWVTEKQNALHAVKHRPSMIAGMNHYNQVIKPNIIQQFDLDGNFISEYKNGKDASNATGVCHRNILQVAKKEEFKKGHTRKQAGGFIWKYKK